MNNSVQHTGSVKFKNLERGFGFIKPDDGSEDIFFHVTKVVGNVEQGDDVCYEIGQGKKGEMAINVTKTN